MQENIVPDNTDIEFATAAQFDDLKDKAVLPVNLKGVDIILVRVDGNYYTVENHCPHSGGDISLGKLEVQF